MHGLSGSVARSLVPLVIALSGTLLAQSEMERDFAWFEGLGFPPPGDVPFVKVDTGWDARSDDEIQKNYVIGFLLHESADHLTIRDLGFSEHRLAKKVDPMFKMRPPTYERIDFAAHVRRFREQEETGFLAWSRDSFSAVPGVPGRSLTFIQAWLAAKRGHHDLAGELYSRARRVPEKVRRADIPEEFRESLEAQISHVLMWRAVAAFGDLEVGRPELLAEFERITKHFPDSEHSKRAGELAGLLRRMIAEDDARLALTPEEIQQLPVDEQVAEWVFRLRDQNGRQWSQPGSCDIFNDWGRKERGVSPAHMLVVLGNRAVPGLIEGLDDQRLTRSVGFHRDFHFSHHVLRVGDCAARILARISGEGFFNRHRVVSPLATDSAVPPTTKARAGLWWTEFQKVGEEEMLVRGVGAGGDEAVVKAKMLSERYPDRLFDALVKGIDATRDAWPRTALVGMLVKIDGDAAVPHLQKEMATSPVLACRAAAAEALVVRGQSETAISAMIEEWKDRSDWIKKSGGDSWPEGPVESLMNFLLCCDDPRAVRIVRESLRDCDSDLRYAILDFLWQPEGSWRASDETWDFSAQTMTEIERLLIIGLEDLSVRSGLSGRRGDLSYADPRHCDMAAEGLAARFPDRYEADISASFKKRETMRIRSLNTWRKNAGLEPITGFPFIEPEPVDVATLDPLLSRIGDPGVLREIEKLGLGTLPALWATERAMPEGESEKQAARASVMRLANRVVRVTVDGKVANKDAAWLVAVRKLEGMELTPERFAGVLRAFASGPNQGSGGISLIAIRHDDLTGIDVKLVIETLETSATAWGSVHYATCVQRGSHPLLGMSGSGTGSRYRESDGLNDLFNAATKALAYPPDEEATIREGLTRDAN